MFTHHHEIAGLNTELVVQSIDEIGPGGAYHSYVITGPDNRIVGTVQFQKGGVKEAGGVNGVSCEALLAICLDRFESFQAGPFASDFNQRSLDAVKEALAAQAERTKDRTERGVEGVSTK
jgi:hypothetical protein